MGIGSVGPEREVMGLYCFGMLVLSLARSGRLGTGRVGTYE